MAVAALSYNRHSHLALKKARDYQFAAKKNFVPVWGSEIFKAALYYPVGFVQKNSLWSTFAVTGLRPEENLFVDVHGRWIGEYVPATLRAHPFVLANLPGQSDPVLGIIEDDPALVARDELSGGDINPLFTELGKHSDITQKATQLLNMIARNRQATRQFIDQLSKLNLLVPWEIYSRDPESGKEINVQAIYKVDETRFNSLTDQDVLSLWRSRQIGLVYAHLLSIPNVSRLEKLLHSRANQKSPSRLSHSAFLGDGDDLFRFD